MGIFVAFAVAELFHEFGGCVADVERDGEVAGLPDGLLGIGKRHVGAVALDRRGKVDGALGECDAAFGIADFGDCFEAGIGKEKGVGIAVADVFGGEDEHAAGDEDGVFATFNHAGEPVDGSVGVASAHGFDEGTDDVVVHFALLVVEGKVLLDDVGGALVVDDNSGFGRVVYDQLDGVEEFAGVAP